MVRSIAILLTISTESLPLESQFSYSFNIKKSFTAINCRPAGGLEVSSSPFPEWSFTIRRPGLLFALIIGIDQYHSSGIRDLSGAVADADAVDAFLQEALRIPEGQIKNLCNEEATRLAIETAIKDLGNTPAIKKDDAILIFYAGHGAEANTPSGWASANGKIQMLVPHDFILGGSSDSKQGQGVLDVRFSHLLADLADKKSDNITVILDCCYLGSGTRADDDDPTYIVPGLISQRRTLSLRSSHMWHVEDTSLTLVGLTIEDFSRIQKPRLTHEASQSRTPTFCTLPTASALRS
ncbi:hypothetical protein IW261DRAFT_1579148 [Armillaria novae-zelandiae]|uniref:Peptidase C14 caspase domain-containing protein n=1 Tax=Armillaria novae-zelandiae TaxID=153914 RepID=A0AA39KFQ6_9AGAR|nr:hypothetical protein IW261DRAFT_1579148 [Armillaria novae-zelandiae]